MKLLGLSMMAAVAVAQYCPGANPGPTSALDSNLGPVSMGDIDNTNDCPGQVGVQDFSSMSTSLGKGGSYTLNYHVTTCGGTYTRVSAAWIDFNQNGVWEDTEMLGGSSVTTTTADNLVAQDFTVPADAVDGPTMLRVAVQERATPSLSPCDAFGYGGVKDFSINIGGKGAGGLSDGSWFLIVVFGIFLPVYTVGGAAFNHNQGKTGIELVPNLDFWRDFPTNVKAGVEKTIGFCKGLAGKKTDDFAEI
jgi:hypothetical protein